ncbi:MAG: hypothetical protein C0459_03070 [Chitinophaga sp.]|jgi:hypothetical protein|nr:hypothetical protein [Chitinophaga sp.]
MTEKFNQIENKLINLFNEFVNEVDEKKIYGDRLWTKELKKRIAKLGLDEKYQVATSGFKDTYEPEWLFDLTWYSEDDFKRLKKLHLVVESEWDRKYSGIKYDFEKLLIAKADLKLLICQSSHDNLNELFLKFEDAINAFSNTKGDRYLFAVLDSDSERKFYFKTH